MELADLLIQAFPILLLILIFFTAAAIIYRKQQKKFKAFLVSSAACAVLLAADIIAFDRIPYPIDPPPLQIEKMPDLVGQNFSECKKNYSDSFKLTVESQEYSSEYPDGAIISHSPSAGKDFLLGEAEVKCVLSMGIRYVSIPNVTGLPLEAADVPLTSCGFSVVVVYNYSDEYEPDVVIKSAPCAGEELPYGSEVVLTVSMGKEN